jgi:hypothetical protein
MAEQKTIETLEEVLYDFLPNDNQRRTLLESRLRPMLGKSTGVSEADVKKRIDQAVAETKATAEADKATALKEQADTLKAEFEARLKAAK